MKTTFFKKTLLALKLCFLACFTTLFMSSCTDANPSGNAGPQIAPSTLDGVKIELFDAFSMELFKLEGEAGRETGAADYDSTGGTFFLGITDTGGSIGLDYVVPVLLEDVAYTYNRTSGTTGRIVFTWTNRQQYPYPEATDGNRIVRGGEIFWGGPSFSQTELTLDVLFSDQGGAIINTTTRVRVANEYLSVFVGNAMTGSAVTTVTPVEFDSTTVRFTREGRPLPANFGADQFEAEDEPGSVTWTTIQGRTIDFVGSDITRRVAYQSTGGTEIDLPADRPAEESGLILVDSVDENAFGVDGRYSYLRTGGPNALFAIRFTGAVDPDGDGIFENQVVNVLYTLTFTNLDGGIYVDSNGATGTFKQDNLTNR